MRMLKRTALVFALLLVSALIMSCGASQKVTVNVTVTVIIPDLDDVYFGPVTVPVEGKADDPPTILRCVKEAFILNDMKYETDESEVGEFSITSIGDYKEKTEGDYTYFWDYTLNGEEPKSGRAGTIIANEGDVIVYTYYQVLTEELASKDTLKNH